MIGNVVYVTSNFTLEFKPKFWDKIEYFKYAWYRIELIFSTQRANGVVRR